MCEQIKLDQPPKCLQIACASMLKNTYLLDPVQLGFSPTTLPKRKQCVASAIYLPHSIHTLVYKEKKKNPFKKLVCVCVFNIRITIFKAQGLAIKISFSENSRSFALLTSSLDPPICTNQPPQLFVTQDSSHY